MVLYYVAMLKRPHVCVPGIQSWFCHAASVIDQMCMPVVLLGWVCNVAHVYVVQYRVFRVFVVANTILIEDLVILIVGRYIHACLHAYLFFADVEATVVDRVHCHWCEHWYVLECKNSISMDLRGTDLGFQQQVMVHFVKSYTIDSGR